MGLFHVRAVHVHAKGGGFGLAQGQRRQFHGSFLLYISLDALWIFLYSSLIKLQKMYDGSLATPCSYVYNATALLRSMLTYHCTCFQYQLSKPFIAEAYAHETTSTDHGSRRHLTVQMLSHQSDADMSKINSKLELTKMRTLQKMLKPNEFESDPSCIIEASCILSPNQYWPVCELAQYLFTPNL